MRITIETEERDEALDMLNHPKVMTGLYDLKDFLRSVCKYRELTEDQITIAEEIRDKFYEYLGEFLE